MNNQNLMNMKNIFFMALAVLFSTTALAQPEEGPEIEFEKKVHDFGNLEQNGDASCEFKFTNKGTEPLIISNARGSCGCTVPQWPRKPIAPGESETIKVKYDSKRLGPINKSVTITSNAKENTTVVLRIKGKIEETKTSPENKNTGAPVAQ